jgi:hypothetical protein
MQNQDADAGTKMVQPLLIQIDSVLDAFQSVRDIVIFTRTRIIAVNVQGITEK